MIFDNYDTNNIDNIKSPDMDWIRGKAKQRAQRRRTTYTAGLGVAIFATLSAGFLFMQNGDNTTYASQNKENSIQLQDSTPSVTSADQQINSAPPVTLAGQQTLCGTSLPEGFTAFPRSNNNEPTETRIENKRLVATFVNRERSFDVVWPAPPREERGDNAAFKAHLEGAKNNQSAAINYEKEFETIEFYFGDDAEKWEGDWENDPENVKEVDRYEWFTLENTNFASEHGCDQIQIRASIDGETIVSKIVSFKTIPEINPNEEMTDTPPLTQVSEINQNELRETGFTHQPMFVVSEPYIAFSKKVSDSPSKIGGCHEQTINDDILGKQPKGFPAASDALIDLLNSRTSLIDYSFIELVESDNKIVYILGNPEGITNSEKTDFSDDVVMYVIEVQKGNSGWSVTSAKFPGC